VRLGLIAFHEAAERNAYFVLLRSFRPKVAFGIKSSIIPNLCAYGGVETASDTTFREAIPVNPEGAPLGDAKEVDLGPQEWGDRIKQMIETSDVIIFDITEISHWLAWELVQACRLRDPSVIIIVCQPGAVVAAQIPLFERLLQCLGQHIDAEAAINLVQQLQPPIYYTDDLVNLTFCWQLYKRLQTIRRRKRWSR
jgi:hypothetical protein